MTPALVRKVKLNCTHMSLLDLIKVEGVRVRVCVCLSASSRLRESDFKKLSPVNCQPWRPYADLLEGTSDLMAAPITRQ